LGYQHAAECVEMVEWCKHVLVMGIMAVLWAQLHMLTWVLMVGNGMNMGVGIGELPLNVQST
jgi:hypothetical protein